jgi:alkylhydroperoxidase family enzyme
MSARACGRVHARLPASICRASPTAACQRDEQALSALLLVIAIINVWNRLNAATRQVAGAGKG